MTIKTVFFLTIFACFFAEARASSERFAFTDFHLQQILSVSRDTSTAGIIYVWSPRMPLSTLGVEELTPIAHKLKLPLHVLVDPSAIENEITSASKENSLLKNSMRLESSVLISMSMKIHYPSLVLYKNGQLLSPSRPGYDEPERVEDFLIRRLK